MAQVGAHQRPRLGGLEPTGECPEVVEAVMVGSRGVRGEGQVSGSLIASGSLFLEGSSRVPSPPATFHSGLPFHKPDLSFLL